MDVAERHRLQRARLVGLDLDLDAGGSIDRALIRAGGGLAMGGELEMAYLERNRRTLGLKVNRDPANVVLGGVGVCHSLAQAHLDGKLFVDYLSNLKRTRIRKKLEKQSRQAVA